MNRRPVSPRPKAARVPARFRAVAGVDPRQLPPGTAYPCDDPRVGRRGVGKRAAGTILACATPPEGKRGRFYAVGEVEAGAALSRSERERERTREALRDRYDGPEFDARPARRPRPTSTKGSSPSRALALRALPEPEALVGEVVDLAPPVSYLRPVTWGGRPVPLTREAPVARYALRVSSVRPEALPLLYRTTLQGAGVSTREALPLGARLWTTARSAPVIATSNAVEAVRKSFVSQDYAVTSYLAEQFHRALFEALEDALAPEEASTPGTHVLLEFPLSTRKRRAELLLHPFPLHRDVPLRVRFSQSRQAARLIARAVRFASGDVGVLVDVVRAAEAPLPRWFPGEAPQALAERTLTPAQDKAVDGISGSAHWRPLRVDLHPDGRARVVYIALPAPRSILLAADKPPPAGALAAKELSPGGESLAGSIELDPDTLWMPVRDIRLMPSAASASLPTFAQTSQEAVDAHGRKARGKVISALRDHYVRLAEALRRGRPVAPEVLAEYPELAAFYEASLRTGRSRAEIAAEEEAAQRALDWADDPDITVHWSVQQGLLLYTRGKDAAIIAAIKGLRGAGMSFKWSRNLEAWFRPQSVGVSESTLPIDRVAKALRAAGMVVRVEREREQRDLGEANERRQKHKFWRADRYADRAGTALTRGAETEARAEQIRSGIAVGAPTRRAERAEARAERLEGKAAGEYEYVQHAASAAQNLAARAASYDTTAEITRREAERRTDDFARIFVPKIKGAVGAERLFSKKTNNLSEYRVAWGVLYPAASMIAAQVVYDGRSILVRPLTMRARDGWEHVLLYDGRTSLHDRTELPSPTLARDVTALGAEEVFDLVVEAMPKVATKKPAKGSAEDPGARRPSSRDEWLRTLSHYGARRVTKALGDALALRSTSARWVTEVERGERHRAEVVGPHVMRSTIRTPTPRLVFVVHHGLGNNSFRASGYPSIELAVEPEGAFVQRVDSVTTDKLYQRATESIEGPEVPVPLDGLTVAEAWELIVAHARALITGAEVVLPKHKARRAPKASAEAAPSVRPGRGVVQALRRDETDAAARERAAEVRARVEPLVADAADRLAEHMQELAERNPQRELLQAVRAAGNDLGFYPTPPALAARAVELAGVRPGDRVLEPSAGTGSIVEALVAAGAEVAAVEMQADRAAFLRAAWQSRGVSVRVADFLRLTPGELGLFDAVVLNPPFSVDGRRYTDADHVMHAAAFVRPGGTLVAIMAPTAPTRGDARTVALRDELKAWNPRWEAVAPKQFRASGTDIPVVLLTLTRPA